MAVFVYTYEKNGKLEKGKIDAKNLQLAKIKLNARKIDPVYIKERSILPFGGGGYKVKKSVMLFFTRQLSFLLTAGVSLVQALEMCIDASNDPNLKVILRRVLRQLEAGKKLSQTFRGYPDVFDAFYVNMIVCAEQTGELDQILKDLATYMEKSEMIKSRVRSAMMYPIIVLFIALSIISAIILFVVPQFASMYEGSENGLPALTQFLVLLSDLMRNNLLLLLGFVVGIPVGIYQYAKTDVGKIQLKSLVNVMPLFSKIQYEAGMVRFFRSFHSLLRSGVNFLEALNVAHDIADHRKIQYGINLSKKYVTEGKSFAQGLRDSKSFPPLVYNMVKIGEESGKMEQSFENLTVYYEELLENFIAGMIKMIEPLLIVVLGGIVGVLILALYLPIFSMGDIV